MKTFIFIVLALCQSSLSFAIDFTKPDVVVLTESLSALPSDLVKHTMLSKVFRTEQIFVYQEEPTYLEMTGLLRRLAFEQNLSVSEDILKFFLSTEAEVAMWKDDSGRIEDYQLVFPLGSIKKIFLNFVTSLADLSYDTQVKVEQLNEDKKITINLGSKKIYCLLGNQQLLVSTFEPKLSSNEHKKLLSEQTNKLYGKGPADGFYTAVTGRERKDDKHLLYVDARWLTFNYQYFVPYLKGFIASFGKTEWKYFSVVAGKKFTTEIAVSEIWKMAPRSPAMCFALPVDMERIAKMLTFKEIQKGADGKETEVVNEEFKPEELKAFGISPVGVCWYASSKFLTPVFMMKPSALKDMPMRVKYLFNKYVGMYEYEEKDKYQKFPVEEMILKEGMTLTRQVSSPGGNYPSPDVIPAYKYSKLFKVKLLLVNQWIAFSADDKLVDEVRQVIEKKSPSLYDEMKQDKELNFIIFPTKISALMLDYIDSVLKNSSDPVFKTTTQKFFHDTTENLKQVHAFGFHLPTDPTKEEWNWMEIPTRNL